MRRVSRGRRLQTAVLGTIAGLFLVTVSPLIADAVTKQSCPWASWSAVGGPGWCQNNGNGTKYAWDEVSYTINGAAINVWDNDYAGCPSCTGQSDVPRWRRELSQIGSYSIGVGSWYSYDYTTQVGFNPNTNQDLHDQFRIKICYEATSENGFFCGTTTWHNMGT